MDMEVQLLAEEYGPSSKCLNIEVETILSVLGEMIEVEKTTITGACYEVCTACALSICLTLFMPIVCVLLYMHVYIYIYINGIACHDNTFLYIWLMYVLV